MSCCGKKRQASRAGRPTLASPAGVLSRRPDSPPPSAPSLTGGTLKDTALATALPDEQHGEGDSREASSAGSDKGETDV